MPRSASITIHDDKLAGPAIQMRNFLIRGTAVMAAALLTASPAAARQKFIEGVFTATESGAPIELIAWAEPYRGGVLKMGHGFLEDAPVLPRTYRFLVNVGGFSVVGVLAVNQDVFKRELDRLDSKMLPHSAVKLNISTVEVGVPELEDWDKVLRLRKSLKATEDKQLVFFLVLHNGTVSRFYPFFLDRQ
jgi:hypothetical protein